MASTMITMILTDILCVDWTHRQKLIEMHTLVNVIIYCGVTWVLQVQSTHITKKMCSITIPDIDVRIGKLTMELRFKSAWPALYPPPRLPHYLIEVTDLLSK